MRRAASFLSRVFSMAGTKITTRRGCSGNCRWNHGAGPRWKTRPPAPVPPWPEHGGSGPQAKAHRRDAAPVPLLGRWPGRTAGDHFPPRTRPRAAHAPPPAAPFPPHPFAARRGDCSPAGFRGLAWRAEAMFPAPHRGHPPVPIPPAGRAPRRSPWPRQAHRCSCRCR